MLDIEGLIENVEEKIDKTVKIMSKTHIFEAVKEKIDTDGDGELDLNEVLLFITEIVKTAMLIKNTVR